MDNGLFCAVMNTVETKTEHLCVWFKCTYFIKKKGLIYMKHDIALSIERMYERRKRYSMGLMLLPLTREVSRYMFAVPKLI